MSAILFIAEVRCVMDANRTPDSQFADLADYPFAPHYLEVPDGDGGTLRVHYLDEAPVITPASETDADTDNRPTFLLMHGEPTWSYLYRNIIPPLRDAGYRVVAPDLVGFGKSDKPTEQEDYTYARHVAWMESLLIEQLDLSNLILFGQDWGGLVGLRLLAAHPDRFAGAVLSNTSLPTGNGKPSDAFLSWQKFARETDSFPVGLIVNGGTLRELSPAEIAAYEAPFPDDSFMAGARIFPALVPSTPDDPAYDDQQTAWESLRNFTKPMRLAFADQDPITKGADRAFHERVPGTQGQPHTTIENAGHFVQEDQPRAVADELLKLARDLAENGMSG